MKSKESDNIVECPSCGTRNRIGYYNKKLKPICGRCRASLFDKELRVPPSKGFLSIIINFILILSISGVCVGIFTIPKVFMKDFSNIIIEEKQKSERLRDSEEIILIELKKILEEELKQIDPNVLKNEATKNYMNIYNARKRYDGKYALSPREKGQLKMLEISSDATKTYRDIILEIAKEASPKRSEIRIEDPADGISLHIDFDMSSMTHGEEGIRTKHDTVSSLKKEVILLISRVTNDVFEFCRGLDIENIYVGCKHHVNVTYPDGTKVIENTILYKIKINKNSVSGFENNPFLDEYSTTKHLDVEIDDFENIEIVREPQ